MKQQEMEKEKMRLKTIILSAMIAMTGTFLLSSGVPAKADSPVLITEGTDTPMTITGYTDFKSGAFRFLEEGDKVAVISPSALPSWEQFEGTMNGLREWGYVPVAGKYVCVEERTLDDCLEDLRWALADPEIKAIFCVRGGYAASEVMDLVPLSVIEQADKPIIGYSDITVYLSSWTKAGLLSVHGSMASAFTSLPEQCAEAERKILRGEVPSYQCGGSEYDLQGTAQGTLIGGNLATLTSVLNTAYDCTSTGEPYILFLEEVEEDYEHIHRFLTILDRQGVLDNAAGIVFGEWADYPEECETYSGNSRGGKFTSPADMISRQFMKDRNIPVAFGFPAGHGGTNYPLLMGADVKLVVDKDSFSLEWLPKPE